MSMTFYGEGCRQAEFILQYYGVKEYTGLVFIGSMLEFWPSKDYSMGARLVVDYDWNLSKYVYIVETWHGKGSLTTTRTLDRTRL